MNPRPYLTLTVDRRWVSPRRLADFLEEGGQRLVECVGLFQI